MNANQDKIFNPLTGRFVSKTGKVGRSIKRKESRRVSRRRVSSKSSKPLEYKGKIAICFLITKDIINLPVWEKWWSGYEKYFNIYAHYSDNFEDKITQPILLNNRVNSVPTKWGDVSLVYAEKELYKKAYKYPSNKFFMLASDSCIPVRDFEHCYKKIFRDMDRGIAPFRKIGRFPEKDPSPYTYERQCYKLLHFYNLDNKSAHAMDQWKILSRRNAKDFLLMISNKKINKLYKECIDIVPDSLAPDELMFALYLSWKYDGDLKSQLRNKLVTFVDFKTKDPTHPINYKHITGKVKREVCMGDAILARKFVEPKEETLLKEIPVKCKKN